MSLTKDKKGGKMKILKLKKKGIVNNKNSGITLISLVVTIIVLLILAGISISMLAGDNSVLQRATDAKQASGDAQIRERIRLSQLAAISAGNGNLTEPNLKAELTKEFGAEGTGYTITDNGTSWEVAIIGTNVTETIPHNPGKSDTLMVTATQRATESRVAVIQATVDEEQWLRSLSKTELKNMLAKAWYGEEADWGDLESDYGNSYSDVSDFYQKECSDLGYNNEYQMMIGENAVDTNLYNTTYRATFNCNGETITGTSAEFVVTKNGSYTISATQGEESVITTIEVDKCKIEEYSDIQQSNSKIENDGYEVWIPAGFAYGTSENVGKVTTGLVITDSVEVVNGKNYSNGNEWVWIPVDKDNLTVGKTTKAMATNIGTTENPNYRGVLYNWTDATGTTQMTYRSTGYREPDGLSYDTGDYSSYGITATTMQNDYNAMIASIKKYGGFYVARYETGDGAANISRLGVKPISAAENEANMWYGLYNRAKAYNKAGVTSGMIWGSQYDAMLNFGLTNSSDASKVNANTNGNHSGKLVKTGIWLGSNNEADKINNIFDLEGNLREFTKEANDTHRRTFRGGYYSSGYGGAVPPCGRGTDGVNSNYTPSPNSSRLSLYINP